MGFEITWADEEKTVIRYRAVGLWDWKDYHTCVRGSLFRLHRHANSVDTIVDFRESTRPTLPSGLPAHVRTFGKKLHPNISGRVVVIGFPDEVVTSLGAVDHQLATPDGKIHFVMTDEAAREIIAVWREHDQTMNRQ
ncbi:MAG TPA: hypothetical protein VHL11_09995 [Phototrophicaceae bacterium]|jgi:hypothetical protein|nr:hypothetical protein [Phototrophicaceae bacterium]